MSTIKWEIAATGRALIVVLCSAVLFLLLESLPAAAAESDEARHYLALGADAYNSGDIVQATKAWSQAIEFCRLSGDRDLDIDARARRGEAYGALGNLDAAIEDLSTALNEARAKNDVGQLALLSDALGNAYFRAHLLHDAEPLLQQSYATAKTTHAPFLAASANNWGNYLASVKRENEALAVYGDALDGSNAALEATVLTNRARVFARLNRADAARADLARALSILINLPPSRDTVLALAAVGWIAMDLPNAGAESGYQLSYDALSAAASTGKRLNDARMQSLAQGYLGELYERAGRNDDALTLADRAIIFAQTTGADTDLLYRWQWLRGRVLRTKGDTTGALVAFRAAVADLATVRQDIPIEYNNGRSSFRETIGPLYYELADLLMRQATKSTQDDARKALLIEAQQTVESLKTAEIKDYFHDACIAPSQSDSQFTGRLEPHTAALYPILLPDRLELLLSLPNDIVQVTVPVDQERLTREVRLFRALVDKRITNEYLVPARQLYDWLVAPVEARLKAAGIDTIVFVPDGALRTIPIAALFDGHHYVIERYAVATAPGLSLVAPKAQGVIAGEHALVAGLTVKVRNFAALPNVAGELSAIGQEVHANVLKDAAFTTDAVKRRVEQEPYSVIHIASHGVFSSDSGNSYLVTYDGELKLDELAKDIRITSLREQPLSLLTLSACQTAAGDDRAALGLAGVAVKSGAETAVATLWLVDDAAAADVMPTFYRALATPGITKAKAMQKAQIAMLSDARFSHPGYWAAFLLIGNWQ